MNFTHYPQQLHISISLEMTNVTSSWTMSRMFDVIFEHCFPTDLKNHLRTQLSNATQGNRKLRDFVRSLEKLADRFTDVNECIVIQAFWNGIQSRIRLRLIEWGISPEHT